MNCALTTVKVPTKLVQRYSTLAHLTGHDSNYYMEQALLESIDKLEYEHSLLQQLEDLRNGSLKTYSLDEVKAHCELES